MSQFFYNLRVAIVVGCCWVVVGCAGTQHQQALWLIPALDTAQGRIEPVTAYQDSEQVTLLAMTEEMQEYLSQTVPQGLSKRQRVVALYHALRAPGLLGVEYQRGANVTAQQAFQQGEANCLGFSNLFVATARSLGLPARYQLVNQQPEWSQRGDYVEKALHINVIVPISRDQQFVVDISPRPVTGRTASVSDRQAAALFYNNQGSTALVAGDKRLAYEYYVKAIVAAPEMEMLWVNLAVLLRQNDQADAALAIYQHVLSMDPDFRSAHYNLAILYQQQGNSERADFHRAQVERYQQKIKEQLSMLENQY